MGVYFYGRVLFGPASTNHFLLLRCDTSVWVPRKTNKILSLCYGLMRVLMGWDYCCYLWQILHDLLFGHIELRFMWLKEWDMSLFSFM